MTGITLTSNGTASTTKSTRVGQQFGITAFGTLGDGSINIVLTPDDGGGARTIRSYVAAELPLAIAVDVPQNNVMTVTLTGATSPNVRIDVDLIQTYRVV